jgi:inhibitor of KinA
VFVRFGDSISPGVHALIRASLEKIDRLRPPWVVDCIPSYCSLLVVYQPLQVRPSEVHHWLGRMLCNVTPDRSPGRIIEIPVWYDASVAPDLAELAQSKSLSVEHVIQIHSAPEYLVYMLGFKPGFPFLGGLDERLWTPRLDVPRLEVAAGSVGIGGQQTGIYPVKSPGGWRIIGRTPIKIFRLKRPQPFLIQPGDRVKFSPIGRDKFRLLEEKA